MLGKENYITPTRASILKYNILTIHNKIERSNPIVQTNGILQRDPLSPLLFNIATADVIKITATENTEVYLYADDMALTSTKADDLQSSLNNLTTWAEENSLKINAQKSSLMVFREGGRIA